MGAIITAVVTFIAGLFGKVIGAGAKMGAYVTVGIAILATLLLPVSSFFDTFASSVGGLPSGVIWFCDVMQLPNGLSIVGLALAVRFVVRRVQIPV